MAAHAFNEEGWNEMSGEHKITNTATDSLAADLHRAAVQAGVGFLPATIQPAGAIEAQEAAGQRELLAAAAGDWAKLPRAIHGVSGDELVALGFEVGEVVQGDDLFVNIRLPEGWYVDGTSHSMHSTLRDAEGFRRAGIFYKAAYYDRRADLNWSTVPVTDAQEQADNAIKDELGEEWSYSRRSIVNDGTRAVLCTYEGRDSAYKSTGEYVLVVVEPNGAERSREKTTDASRKGEWL